MKKVFARLESPDGFKSGNELAISESFSDHLKLLEQSTLASVRGMFLLGCTYLACLVFTHLSTYLCEALRLVLIFAALRMSFWFCEERVIPQIARLFSGSNEPFANEVSEPFGLQKNRFCKPVSSYMIQFRVNASSTPCIAALVIISLFVAGVLFSLSY